MKTIEEIKQLLIENNEFMQAEMNTGWLDPETSREFYHKMEYAKAILNFIEESNND